MALEIGLTTIEDYMTAWLPDRFDPTETEMYVINVKI